MAIESLPDFPALQQFARALWRRDGSRGAAVLVGAGFSRNADRAGIDTPEPPLWQDLANGMAERLYPGAPDHAPKDPLRLAEEYRTYLGQAALDEFIRTRIRDEAWQPGPQHHALLELPWSDVLTTNWDTLLERAARVLEAHGYEPVLSEVDIAHARAPRIVKLHGSMGTNGPFIVAEEDYRTYPARFAAFVNLARQVFLENELCLIGFSGDDPNFLQWAGWVRDHLGGGARRIYLVGAFELGPAKRKLLEARNVAPIDFAPLVAGRDKNERHAAATEAFLSFLKAAKPKQTHEWQPADTPAYAFAPTSVEDRQQQRADPAYAASLLEKVAEVWRSDRQGYPGWLVCPPKWRARLRHRTTHAPWLLGAALDALEPERRATILYELAWRHRTAFWPIDDGLVERFAEAADPARPCGLAKRQQLEIAALLLEAARRSGDDDALGRWAGILEVHARPGSDLRADAAYQRLLRARDGLDFAEVSQKAPTLQGQDPVWRLRRAALHCECGEFAEAERLIAEALADLRERQRNDRASLWVRSRRAWAQWLALAVQRSRRRAVEQDNWPSEFRDADCDPWQEVERLERAVADALREQLEKAPVIVPAFSAGLHNDRSRVIRFQTSTQVGLSATLACLLDTVGVPMRLDGVNLLGAVAKNAADLEFEPTLDWHLSLLRALQSHSDALIESRFGRVAVAQMPPGMADELLERVKGAAAFWRQRMGAGRRTRFATDRMRMFVEILSRLTVHQSSEAALASFDLAVEFARDPVMRHRWMYD